MRRILFVVGLTIIAICVIGALRECNAQSAAPVAGDAKIIVYQQLLTRANEELSEAIIRANTLATENAQLKTEIAAFKAHSANKPKTP